MIFKEKVLPQYMQNGIIMYKRIKDLLRESEENISVPENVIVSRFEIGRSGLKRIQWGIWRDFLSFGTSPTETNKKLGEIIKAPSA